MISDQVYLDAAFNNDPIGTIPGWMYHRSCAERDGKLAEWKPAMYDSTTLCQLRCKACNEFVRFMPVLPPMESIHFL